ncbi:MAG: hypothetical protein GXX85_09075 [Ignavibacteria bacterium]|mgnify:FL=1|nr:hypothetical protein [Ignavibacteria bacterium]
MLSEDYTTVFRLAKELKNTQDEIFKWLRKIKSGGDAKDCVPEMIQKMKSIDTLLSHYGLDQIQKNERTGIQ